MLNAGDVPEELLRRARQGDPAALGRLLDLYRNYLRLVVRTQMGGALRGRVEPSDLVQDTLLEAHRDFGQFAGTGERELTVWLRRILARNLADQVKYFERQGRDWQRHQSLDELLDQSCAALGRALAGPSSPSAQAVRREAAVLLADALERLPADYREVIVLRNFEHLSFEDVAARMGRGCGAVRMLWVRALEKLAEQMEGRA